MDKIEEKQLSENDLNEMLDKALILDEFGHEKETNLIDDELCFGCHSY